MPEDLLLPDAILSLPVKIFPKYLGQSFHYATLKIPQCKSRVKNYQLTRALAM